MSIAIPLGVTTPETSYSDMAAGSDPESVEASPAVNEKTYNHHSCGSAKDHGYRVLPYAMQQSSVVCCQDHNYGAPPPPTPPASPLSQTIFPRMDLNGMVHSSRYHQTPAEQSADSDSSSEEDGAGSGWCHCSGAPEDLHSKCKCRELDRRKEDDDQHRKPETVSAGDSSATESGDEEVSPSTISYTATQHTPTSIKLTVNRVKSRKSKKRKKSMDKARGMQKTKKVKAFREGSRKSLRMKSSATETTAPDESTAEGWESRIRQWTDQYEEALANQYSSDIQTLLQAQGSAPKPESSTTAPPSATHVHMPTVAMDTISCTELACNNTVLGSQMQFQLGRVTRVQKHRKILRAAKSLEADSLIIEYRGKVMLKQQFEVNGHFFKKPCPFVLFYSKFNDVEMCVDARTLGNDARFIRRSCTPNAEVRHMMAEGMIHLCIYAIGHITKDSEVTIGFDYEFNNCKYKVDCACHKGNQNCPVQKHNLSPPTQILPSPPVGAETRRRKAQRKELESSLVSTGVCEDLQGTSDSEERVQDGLKVEEEEREALSSKRTLNTLERRSRAEAHLLKSGDVEAEDGNAADSLCMTQSGGVGVSTRRTICVTEAPLLEKTSSPALPTTTAAPPKPMRPAKPRSKSRISRYRSSSSQRARRQRQALAHQASAAAAVVSAQAPADQGSAQNDEGFQGPYGAEHRHGEPGTGGAAQYLDGDNQGPTSIHRGIVRYPKTKKYLVTEWLNDKVPGGEKVHPEVPVERPLRITTDPTVLATTLNMLPGHAHSSLICTTPRHYIRFGSPFNPERRRPRPLQMDGTYGCYKKRWIKQMEDESYSTSVEDGTESTSSQQSTSSRSTPNPLCSEVSAPFKKRHYKCITEIRPVPPDHLLHPLSPVSPPLPDHSLDQLVHNACGFLLLNGLADSPKPSLCTSRCNTPLQFENISSPEASPVHQAESVSPEPSLQADFDASRPPYLGLESPVAMTSDEFCIHGVTSGHDSQSQLPVGALASCPSSDSHKGEQAFRTEFNLIYTCSPLNANVRNPLSSDQHPPQVDGGCSPSDSLHGSLSVQGPGSMSPYGDPYYSGGTTPPYTSNPPQKKKRATQPAISLLTGKTEYEAIALRGENKPVQKMVSLLEYRKRKQGSVGDSQQSGSSRSRPGSYHSTDSHCSQSLQQVQNPASPHHSSSSARTACVPQREDVRPPDNHKVLVKTSNQWMVPTTVERLREGRGVLERVLRSIKMEQVYKSSDTDHQVLPVESVSSSTGSPPVYTLQPAESPTQSHGSSLAQQTSSSPFLSSYSPPSGQSLYSRLPTYPSPPPTFGLDPRQPVGLYQQTSSSLVGALTSGPRTQRQNKMDLSPTASREGQQQVSPSPRLQCAPGPTPCPQQGQSLGQFQHSPLPGPGVQTQSGSL
uniref:SET domain containing 5 n=1 Tax=Nothobranchius kuhntae TaxID=321403 RepID=A0A1A8JRD4_NOTKU